MKRWLGLCGVFIFLLAILAILQYKGIIWHNELFAMKYDVKGLDVSHHQGAIDWKEVAEKNSFKFVFMKATEGHDFTDPRFATNWKETKEQGILRGAYHFFSMRSPGEEQAKHFIRIVPQEADSLPPVIDVEVHLKHDPQRVRRELHGLADALEGHYGKKPILYVTYDTYETYVEGDFEDFSIWIRDIVKSPSLNRDWLFWQYSNRGRVPGIDTYVDINVFRGSLDEFEREFQKE